LRFLKQLFGRGCAHEFSWPRSGEDGRYYQICLGCGTAYEYDWVMMRRTDRLLVAAMQREAAILSSSRSVFSAK